MAIKRVQIDEGCITCGMSEINCPEVFEIHKEFNVATVKKDVDFTVFESKIKQAAKGCPVEVIKYEEV